MNAKSQNSQNSQSKEKLTQSQQEIEDRVHKLFQSITQKAKQGNYLFRGESKAYDIPCATTLYRHILGLGFSQTDIQEHIIRDIEQSIIDNAKKISNLDGIHLLSEIQHFGGKTNLLDTSNNVLIAVYFACQSDVDVDDDGYLYLINQNNFQNYDAENDQKDFLDKSFIFYPLSEHKRITFQSSVLIRTKGGYYQDYQDAEKITIDKSLKSEILNQLNLMYGINQNSVFNDLIGFINNEENFQTTTSLFYQGLVLIGNNQLQEAINKYTQAIKINPKDYQAHNNRGFAKDKLADIEPENKEKWIKEAIEDYTQAIKINPKSDNAYNNRGVAKGKLADIEPENKEKWIKEVIEDYTQAIKINPKYYQAYYNRGIAKGKLAKIIPDQKESLLKVKEAIEDYTQAIKINPQYDSAYNNRGIAKVELAHIEPENKEKWIKEEIADYTQAIKINPQYDSAYNNRGIAKAQLAHIEPKNKEKWIKEAIEDFTQAIKINPKYDDAYYNRGLSYLTINEKELAKKDFEIAINLAKENNNQQIVELATKELIKLNNTLKSDE